MTIGPLNSLFSQIHFLERSKRIVPFEEGWTYHHDCKNIILSNGNWIQENNAFPPLQQNLSWCARALRTWR